METAIFDGSSEGNEGLLTMQKDCSRCSQTSYHPGGLGNKAEQCDETVGGGQSDLLSYKRLGLLLAVHPVLIMSRSTCCIQSLHPLWQLFLLSQFMCWPVVRRRSVQNYCGWQRLALFTSQLRTAANGSS